MIMSMHNAFCLHIIRKNRPMHRNAPGSVAPTVVRAPAPAPAVVAAVIPTVVSAFVSAVVPATTTPLETTAR